MTQSTLTKKQQDILSNERQLARQVALQVLDKPVPPIWMILIPIFFVFYVWKLKQYSRGLDEFTTHYLVYRQQALEDAVRAEQSGVSLPEGGLGQQAADLPEPAREPFIAWMDLLRDHFRTLLRADGACHAELVRNGYRNKSSYLVLCNRLAKAEYRFNSELVPQIGDDVNTLQEVITKMDRAATELLRRQGDEIFS